ncbi:MAG: hypothetical protein AB2693_28935 [Candidatus Thiodiazotropha sp.]
MDRFLYIRSDDSKDYFPDNKPFLFKVHLITPLSFSGFWKVGLIEFHANEMKSKNRVSLNSSTAISVFSNICKENIVNGEEKPILRRLEKNNRNSWDYILDSPFYIPLKRQELLEFELYIKDDLGNFASFLDSPLHITLHFKQYPFYTDYEYV